MSELQENLTRIRSRIDQACERSGRQPDSVRLMAVSKNQLPERVAEAVSAGLTLAACNGSSFRPSFRIDAPQRTIASSSSLPLDPPRQHTL